MQNCSCEACSIKQKYENRSSKASNLSWFKENTRKIREISDQALDSSAKFGKNSQKSTIFRINLLEFNPNDHSGIEYTKDISYFNFAMLLSEFFGIDIDVDDEDYDDEYEDDVQVFTSIEEVINYLQNKRKDD